jgi:hypothetical protein
MWLCNGDLQGPYSCTLGRQILARNFTANIRKAALGCEYVNNGKAPLGRNVDVTFRRNCDVNIARPMLTALSPGRSI